MNINVSLSVESIRTAIDRLKLRKGHLLEDTEQLVDILTNEGAEVAQSAYEEWSLAVIPYTDKTEGSIIVAGDMPLIAEFGAGDATLEPKAFFENSPDTMVFPGSYSLEHALEYAILGEWRFAGKWMSEVQPKQGLYQAKMHIINTYADTAKEVMTYD